jgi:transposase
MRRRVDVNLDELDQIIDRSTRAPLSEAEGQKLKSALHAMAERLLRKRSTEKTSAVLPPDVAPAGKPDSSQSAPAGHGRNGAAAFTGANRVAIAHATLHAGDQCPECRRGKVYRQKESATLVRFVGHAPLEATVFEMERLRCNACGEVFTADEPDAAGPAKYDETAVAMIALLKYGTGVPFKRLERLQGQLGMPLPATTQWELMETTAKPFRPVLEELIRQAAQGSVMHNDDTSMRILASDARAGRQTNGYLHQRHRIDRGRLDHRAVLYRVEACGREHRRSLETARQRTAGANPNVRCAVAQHAEGRRNPAGELPRPWKTAGGGSGR